MGVGTPSQGQDQGQDQGQSQGQDQGQGQGQHLATLQESTTNLSKLDLAGLLGISVTQLIRSLTHMTNLCELSFRGVCGLLTDLPTPQMDATAPPQLDSLYSGCNADGVRTLISAQT